MPIRLFHPDHGFHNVYSETDVDEYAKRGWTKHVDVVAQLPSEDSAPKTHEALTRKQKKSAKK